MVEQIQLCVYFYLRITHKGALSIVPRVFVTKICLKSWEDVSRRRAEGRTWQQPKG